MPRRRRVIRMHFIERLQDRTATIAVIGLGYVGLPLALRFSEVGFQVLGYDTDPEKTAALNDGRSYIEYITGERIQGALARGFRATTNVSELAAANAVIICVPTPLDAHRQPDLRYVQGTIDAVAPYLSAGQLVSLESTTYPGTTEELLAPVIRNAGLEPGRDLHLVYSPEREDPGNAAFNTQTIPKVVGGLTDTCLEAGKALYRAVVDQVVPVSSLRAAEMTKLLENIHRAVNIGLVNEMKMVADRMDVDIHEVIDAAASKPFGFVAYRPGPGLGGHCIPIDPFYLSWKARAYGINTRFIELAGEVNRSMPEWVLAKLVDALNERERAVKSSRILVLGLAYKKDVDDLRESPALEIMELLRAKGVHLTYHDPHIPRVPKLRDYHFDLESQPLTPQLLAEQHAVILVTDHSDVDYAQVAAHAPLIVDTRGVYRGDQPHVVQA